MNQELYAAAQKFGDRAILCPVGLLGTIESDIEALKESDHYGHAARKLRFLRLILIAAHESQLNSRIIIYMNSLMKMVIACKNGDGGLVFPR